MLRSYLSRGHLFAGTSKMATTAYSSTVMSSGSPEVYRSPASHVGVMQCTVCGEAFSRSAALSRHIYEKHKNAKDVFPFQCSMCPKGFFSKAGLKCHIETHSSKFQCQFCPRTFGYSRNLRRHIELNHDRKECRYCKQYVGVGEEMNEHLKSCQGANNDWTVFTSPGLDMKM